MKVYLVDGTYELFRHYFAMPKARDAQGREVGAVRGVLASMLAMMRDGATHIGVATDHVIESFRNNLWPGYKTGAGIDPDLLSQFPLLEEVLSTAGIVVWPMVNSRGRCSRSRGDCSRSGYTRRTGGYLYTGQGSRTVCSRHEHCPTEPSYARDHR